jgi:hypothetical protein
MALGFAKNLTFFGLVEDPQPGWRVAGKHHLFSCKE